MLLFFVHPVNRDGYIIIMVRDGWVPSLISLMVSVDVKHHVYLEGWGRFECNK